MADTLADRIMEAADAYAGESWAVANGMQFAQERADDNRATLAALVAEACAPPPERVCRWERVRRWERLGVGGWCAQGCAGGECGCVPGAFCPECGGRIELWWNDGQEATDE